MKKIRFVLKTSLAHKHGETFYLNRLEVKYVGYVGLLAMTS